MTLREQIDSTTGIDTYRSLVYMLMAGLVPDPTEYADQLEANPDKFTTMARTLGPDSGANNMHRGYESIEEDLKVGLRATSIDTHWSGAASEAFTDTYIGELASHLAKLADLCEKQKDFATTISDSIQKAQKELVNDVYDMCLYANLWAGGASLVLVPSAPFTAGIASAGAGAAVAGEIIRGVVSAHRAIRRKIEALDTELGGKLLEGVRGLEEESYDGGLASYVSKDGWHSPHGA